MPDTLTLNACRSFAVVRRGRNNISRKTNILKRAAGAASWRVNRALNRLAFRNYSTAKLYCRTRLRLSRVRNPVLVYTMGKVGSTAVAESLESTGADYTIYHLHWLVPERLRLDEALFKSAVKKYRGTAVERRLRPQYIWQGQYLSSRVRKPAPDGGRWKVITLIRDPVARNVSSFFENMELFEYDYVAKMQSGREGELVAELMDLFRKKYVDGSEAAHVDADPLTWFDEELKTVFDVDVFAKDFPFERGFDIYEGRLADVLMIKLEDLGACIGAAFERFLGLEGVALQRSNVGTEKDYAPLYRRFLDVFEIPDGYLDRVYNSKVSRHFYTGEELAKFRSRWKR